jgi:hypothetical protein
MRTINLVKRKRRAPNTPAMPGAMIHAAKTCATPVHPQLTLVMPIDAVPAPTRPPIIECVVETGMPYLVATVRNTEEPKTVHIMASRRTGGASS